MCGECEELLRQAHAELQHARGVLAHARNRTKVETAALSDSVDRMEGLSRRIEARLSDPHGRKEPQGNGKHEDLTQARQ